MKSEAMHLLGKALHAFQQGDTTAELIIRREDGHKTPLPVALFFRDESEFSAVEVEAIRQCKGPVLDVGAGSGLHSLVLQKMGTGVTAIDISPEAVEVMTQRGVKDARCADIFEFATGPYETLLLLGHGIGMVEDLAGLDRFLNHTRGLVSDGAKVILDSMDVRATADPAHLAYHEAKSRAGRYRGEVRMQIEFRDEASPTFGWLHVDGDTLEKHAREAGWLCEVLVKEDGGDYLAKLELKSPPRW